MDEKQQYLTLEEIQGEIQYNSLLIDMDDIDAIVQVHIKKSILSIISIVLVNISTFMIIIDLLNYFSKEDFVFNIYLIGIVISVTITWILTSKSWHNMALGMLERAKVHNKVEMCMYYYSQMERFDTLSDWEKNKIFENDIMPYADLEKS